MTIQPNALTKAGMEQCLRDYFLACNSGDADRVAGFFATDAIHYFPGEFGGGPCRGAIEIGRKCAEMVSNLGSFWTLDQRVCDPETGLAATEWTLENRRIPNLIRGAEWYRIDGDGHLSEVRAFIAMAPDRSRARFELGGFDYAGRGYPVVSDVKDVVI